MEFEGGRALELARRVSFPRAVGSEGESRAVSFIENQLAAMGYFPEAEEFAVPLNPSAEMKWFSLAALASVVGSRFLALLSPVAAGLWMALLFAMVSFQTQLWVRLWGSEKAFQWLARRFPPEGKGRCRNLRATLSPSNPSPHRLYLVAHYDTKSQSLSPVFRVLGTVAICLGSFWLSLSFFLLGPEGIPPAFPLLAVDLPLVVTVGTLLLFSRMTSGNASDGALDNAGSVGILLHLAEVLRKSPPRNTTVYFLFTGAEEMGLQGAFAFLRRHGRDMDPEKCWVINLDCLGIQGKTRVICQNGVPFHFQRSPLMKHLVRAASCFSIRFAPITFGVWMDHLPFLAQGYPAVSLTCFTPKILSVHSSRDTIDHLDPAGAEEPGRFLLALLRGLDDRPPPGALSRTGPGGRADG